MATTSLARKIGAEIQKAGAKKQWYSPHMAAASRAIAERIPLVDFVLEVRDARIPSSSEYEQLRTYPHLSRRIIVMNKMDLANRSHVKEWTKYFDSQSCLSYGVNSHNKENIKEFLNFLQAEVRELKKTGHSSHTTTLLLVGIPNVGKSALANSLHQIGRISAAEKGKLKHAVVSPYPGETKDISSLKIGSHPNIYVLDTPGILPPEILDTEVCSKLALTGAIRDCVVGEKELMHYFMAILNSSDEYKKWAKLSTYESEKLSIDGNAKCSSDSESDMRRKRQYPTDHTQDFVVNDVRRTLSETISSFNGNMEDEKDMERFNEAQLIALRDALRVAPDFGNDACTKVATKLLNLYRTGRLGHYTLDPIPKKSDNFLLCSNVY